MANKNDQNFRAFSDELRAYVEEHHLEKGTLIPMESDSVIDSVNWRAKGLMASSLMQAIVL